MQIKAHNWFKQGLTLLLMFFALLLACDYAAAQTRSEEKLVRITTYKGDVIDLYKGSYALLIGVSQYKYWPDLTAVPGELAEVEAALKERGFTVRSLLDPNSKELENAFEDFIGEYGYDKDNRLLFFFSGHGASREDGSMGYLVPSDAPLMRKDPRGFMRKALSMSQIKTWCREMLAKHSLFLFDSCFSGTIFESKGEAGHPPPITDYTSKPVRYFITAGDAREKVPARSSFTPSFVWGLKGDADLSGDGYITGTELGMYLHDKVLAYQTGQTPQHGRIRDVGLDKGDFVFVLPHAKRGPVPPPPTPGPGGVVKPLPPQEPDQAQAGAPAPVQLDFGYLVINGVSPRQAEVSIDGQPQAPGAFEVSSGSHQVTAKAELYKPYLKTVRVPPGETVRLDVALKPDFGGLQIDSDPAGAEVTLGPLVVGKTPYRNDKIRSGNYTVKLSKDMYLTARREVQVRPERTESITVKLKPNFGTLRLESPTPGAKAKLDNSSLTLGQKVRLSPGRHTLELEAPHHYSRSKTFSLEKGQELTFDWPLKAKTGALSISTDPPGARVILDGRTLEQPSPLIIKQIKSGPHTVEVKGKYHVEQKEIMVKADQVNRVSLKLKTGLTGVEEGSSDGRYSKDHDGVITDSRTGLQWCVGPDWDTNWYDAKKWVEGLSVAGGGWRMPSRSELRGISQKGARRGEPEYLSPIFKTSGWWVWSGETHGSSHASFFNFYGGREGWDALYGDGSVRAFAVRSRSQRLEHSSGERYSKDSDGVITDSRTGLQWYVGPDQNTDWHEANKWVENLHVAGGGWRIPSLSELGGISQKDARSSHPKYLPPIFRTSGRWVWSGKIRGSSDVWSFNFPGGKVGWYFRNTGHFFRAFAVRSRR